MKKTRLEEEGCKLFVCNGVTVILAESMEEAQEMLELMVESDTVPFTPIKDEMYEIVDTESIPDGWHHLNPMTGFDSIKDKSEHDSGYSVGGWLQEQEETQEEQTHQALLKRIEKLEEKLTNLEKKK